MYKILLIFVVFLTGLAISLQGVFGINIGNILNLQGNKITNVGTPTVAGDAATKGLLDSTFNTINFQAKITGSCAVGKVIRVINQDGTVICE
ncbi:MAG: hypothetical protein HYS15_00595 [Candidatus Spechtbacteria bacterium]|nr:hypothetical protein [Candidatus Spechtbacteria bacterium]